MTPKLANKLMERQLAQRWIIAPSPKGKGKVAGLLVNHDGIMATVTAKSYKNHWKVYLDDIKYR